MLFAQVDPGTHGSWKKPYFRSITLKMRPCPYFFENLFNNGYGKLIANCGFLQFMVIDHQTPLALACFAHRKSWRRPLRAFVCWLYQSQSEILVKQVIEIHPARAPAVLGTDARILDTPGFRWTVCNPEGQRTDVAWRNRSENRRKIGRGAGQSIPHIRSGSKVVAMGTNDCETVTESSFLKETEESRSSVRNHFTEESPVKNKQRLSFA